MQIVMKNKQIMKNDIKSYIIENCGMQMINSLNPE